TAGDHKKVQLNELNELCDQAYENSLIYKEKTKRIHDSKIKDRVFNISDRVLIFKSRLEIFSGKLKARWSGPFTISYVYPYGTFELAQPDMPNFKERIVHPGWTSSMTLSGHSEQLTKHQLGVLHISLLMEKRVISLFSLSTKPTRPQNMKTLIFRQQEKTKRIHDSKIKDRVFNISDRVLIFKSRLEIFSGKLKARWSGPFTIPYVYPYGTFELAQPNMPNFKVNGRHLKHYFGEDVPKLVIPDLQTFPRTIEFEELGQAKRP
nr:reverse transcriptase domain-containing protein [Tanacetum cinerariifolium]